MLALAVWVASGARTTAAWLVAVGLALSLVADVVIESFTTDVKVIARAAAIWRKMEPTRDEIAVKGLKFLKKTL